MHGVENEDDGDDDDDDDDDDDGGGVDDDDDDDGQDKRTVSKQITAYDVFTIIIIIVTTMDYHFAWASPSWNKTNYGNFVTPFKWLLLSLLLLFLLLAHM